MPTHSALDSFKRGCAVTRALPHAEQNRAVSELEAPQTSQNTTSPSTERERGYAHSLSQACVPSGLTNVTATFSASSSKPKSLLTHFQVSVINLYVPLAASYCAPYPVLKLLRLRCAASSSPDMTMLLSCRNAASRHTYNFFLFISFKPILLRRDNQESLAQSIVARVNRDCARIAKPVASMYRIWYSGFRGEETEIADNGRTAGRT